MDNKKPPGKAAAPTDPRNKAQAQILCRLEELDDGGAKEVALPDINSHTLFLVRLGDNIRAYRNSCPHTGSPLNWNADKFLSLDGTLIQCAVHGALFRISDGLCIWGPCLNQGLTPVTVAIVNGDIVLTEAYPTAR